MIVFRPFGGVSKECKSVYIGLYYSGYTPIEGEKKLWVFHFGNKNINVTSRVQNFQKLEILEISYLQKLIPLRYINKVSTQLLFTCSKSTKETLEKGVKYAQS